VRVAGDGGKPVVLSQPKSKAAEVFIAISRELACALSVRNRPAPGSGIRSGKLTMIR